MAPVWRRSERKEPSEGAGYAVRVAKAYGHAGGSMQHIVGSSVQATYTKGVHRAVAARATAGVRRERQRACETNKGRSESTPLMSSGVSVSAS